LSQTSADKNPTQTSFQDISALTQVEIRDVISKLNSVVGRYAIDKVEIVGMNDSGFEQSFYDPRYGRIAVGTKLNSGSGETLNTPVFIHEFAHAIFDQHFKFLYQGKVVAFQKLRAEANKKHDDFIKDLEANQDYMTLQADLEALQEERIAMHKLNKMDSFPFGATIHALHKEVDGSKNAMKLIAEGECSHQAHVGVLYNPSSDS
jgi:hypothetical protein